MGRQLVGRESEEMYAPVNFNQNLGKASARMAEGWKMEEGRRSRIVRS